MKIQLGIYYYNIFNGIKEEDRANYLIRNSSYQVTSYDNKVYFPIWTENYDVEDDLVQHDYAYHDLKSSWVSINTLKD